MGDCGRSSPWRSRAISCSTRGTATAFIHSGRSTSRWFYGDAVFILEPWLWLLLGVAVVSNTMNTTGRVLLGAALVGITSLGAYFRQIPFAALIALARRGARARAVAETATASLASRRVARRSRSRSSRRRSDCASWRAARCSRMLEPRVARADRRRRAEPARRRTRSAGARSPSSATTPATGYSCRGRMQPSSSRRDADARAPGRMGARAHAVARRAARVVPRRLLGARLDAVRPRAGDRGGAISDARYGACRAATSRRWR